MEDVSLLIEQDIDDDLFYVSSESGSVFFITYGETPEEAINRFFETLHFYTKCLPQWKKEANKVLSVYIESLNEEELLEIKEFTNSGSKNGERSSDVSTKQKSSKNNKKNDKPK